MADIQDCYFNILEKSLSEISTQGLESKLAEAFELGRKLEEQNVPPDEIISLHHECLVRLARKHPQLNLSDVVEKLSMPLLEMSMAYGLTFRQQMAQRYEDMINNRLQHAAKLEAIGTLAAGLAHDFNNILGSIVGYAEMAGEELSDNTLAKNSIDQILIASFRARDLVSRILAFARQTPMTPSLINVVKEVKESIVLLKSSLPSNVNIQFESGLEKAIILADPSQIQQIIMNLCINSADSMAHGGVISITIYPLEKTPGSRMQENLLETPRDICITVTDKGEGMSEEVKSRAFDPFFTTKAPNKGSGLGLSVVYGIVTRMGGKIELTSETEGENKGTKFEIYIPAANT